MTIGEFSWRPGEAHDLSAIVDIYNHYVVSTPITFDTEAFAVGARTQWFNQFSTTGPYRLLVTEMDGKVAGYASSAQFKPKAAYSTSVETSIYLEQSCVGKGIGRPLYAALLQQLAEEPGVHRAYGGITLPNPQSIALHEDLGFMPVATYHEVGFKLGQYWDVSWYEKEL